MIVGCSKNNPNEDFVDEFSNFEEEEGMSLDEIGLGDLSLTAKLPSSNLRLASRHGNTEYGTSHLNLDSKPADISTSIYTENAKRTSHTLKISKGDAGTHRRENGVWHARTEAWTISQPRSRGNYKVFQAKMRYFGGTLENEMTIAQVFAVDENKPQIAIRVATNGRLKVNGDTLLDGDFRDGTPFFIRIETDGYRVRVKVYPTSSIKTFRANTKSWNYDEPVKYSSNINNSFRWGVYYNTATETSVRNTVSSIYTKR